MKTIVVAMEFHFLFAAFLFGSNSSTPCVPNPVNNAAATTSNMSSMPQPRIKSSTPNIAANFDVVRMGLSLLI
ncbi:hypothetical protein [Caproiciproducens galactitolivorans]|uniref:Secreted protein n=1 Tax=Caproiciproducens galactitolivorans TaxID=642589 RepID=A0ABT4BWN9_9FIRM|nr:hypothetical protein [Caproiciproducens galactitolivorans]MCY1715312.1 hypothetical protein [Caproiciproducens galactitolivorans]